LASSARFGLGIQTSYQKSIFKSMTPDTFVFRTCVAGMPLECVSDGSNDLTG